MIRVAIKFIAAILDPIKLNGYYCAIFRARYHKKANITEQAGAWLVAAK